MRCNIFVKDYYGKTTQVYVDSEKELKNMTVEELKRRVCHENEEFACRLIFAGIQLEDDRTLGDYNISIDTTIGPPPDEDKGVPRTVSMDKLADMRQEESSGWCCIM